MKWRMGRWKTLRQQWTHLQASIPLAQRVRPAPIRRVVSTLARPWDECWGQRQRSCGEVGVVALSAASCCGAVYPGRLAWTLVGNSGERICMSRVDSNGPHHVDQCHGCVCNSRKALYCNPGLHGRFCGPTSQAHWLIVRKVRKGNAIALDCRPENMWYRCMHGQFMGPQSWSWPPPYCLHHESGCSRART